MSQISSLSGIVFNGLSVFIPLLILLKFGKILIRWLNINVLVSATNWLILFASVIYLLFFASMILPELIGYYSQSEYSQYALINRAFGPYWFTYDGYLTIYGLLPQILWFKKVRQSIIPTIIWGLINYVLAALIFYSIHYNNRDFIPANPPNYPVILLSGLISLIAFLPLLAIVYFLLITRQNQLISKQQA